MPKADDDLLEAIRKAGKSGKDLDPGIWLDPKDEPNEELNKAIGAPKGTIIKPVPFPKHEWESDEKIKLRPPKITKDGLILLKKGGAIDLSKCKVNTAKKNSSSSKW